MKNIKIESKMSATMARVYSTWRLLVLNDSNRSELRNVYGTYSEDKEMAMNHCKAIKSELDGQYGIIIGHNSYTFSYGFQFVNPETGALCFAYITKDYDRFCEIDPSKVTIL